MTGLLLTALFVTRLPLALRVLASGNALLASVEGPQGYEPGPGRVGLIFVNGTQMRDRHVFFHTTDGFMLWSYGLVYVRDGGKPEGGFMGYPTRYFHLVGRWWTFAASM